MCNLIYSYRYIPLLFDDGGIVGRHSDSCPAVRPEISPDDEASGAGTRPTGPAGVAGGGSLASSLVGAIDRPWHGHLGKSRGEILLDG